MSACFLTNKARINFFEAFESIATDSLRAAIKWKAQVCKAFDHVAAWPTTGRPRSGHAVESLRTWVVGDYVIFFDSATDPVDIAFLHGARDIDNIMLQRYKDAQPEPEETDR